MLITLELSRSNVKVMLKGQSSWSHEENAAIVVGVTSTEYVTAT